VEYDDRRFKLIYLTLNRKRRAKVGMLAVLGLRASDPETAWLVAMSALAQLRLEGLRLVLGVAAVAVSMWGYLQVHRFAVQLVFPFVMGFVFLASLWTHRRAVRVNEPIARLPERGNHGSSSDVAS
jgi:hypothetical protein